MERASEDRLLSACAQTQNPESAESGCAGLTSVLGTLYITWVTAQVYFILNSPLYMISIMELSDKNINTN